MDRFGEVETRFSACLTRARSICEIQAYLENEHTSALDTSDLLRASVVLTVSAYDFLIHEVFKLEVLFRLQQKTPIKRLQIPFEASISPPDEIEEIVLNSVNEANSYKSFVDPGKYSEAIGCFVDTPWERVGEIMSSNPKDVRRSVRAIYRWRNRIAHEADINPVYAGVELWEISKMDVTEAIDLIEKVGHATITLLRS